MNRPLMAFSAHGLFLDFSRKKSHNFSIHGRAGRDGKNEMKSEGKAAASTQSATTAAAAGHRLAGTAIGRAEEAYRSLFMNMMNSVVHARMIFQGDTPVDMEYLSTNPAFAKVTGITEPVEGRRISEVIPGYCENNPESLQAFGQVAVTGIPMRWEHYLRELDRWFAFMIYSPTRGEVVIVTENITERKRAEETLRESEARLRTILESLQTGVVIIDPETHTIVDVNPVAAALIGEPKERILGSICHAHICPAEKGQCPITDLGQTVDHSERALLQAGGARIPIIKTVSSIMLGGREHLLESFIDIRERKRAGAERERLMAAIEQSGEVIVITSPEGSIEYVNPAFERVTGYTRAEALGQNPRILKSGKHDAAFYREIWATIANGKTWTGRLVNKRKDGTLYTEAATISPIRDASGQLVNYVAVKRDITEHLRLESQFQQAQKMESVGRLAGGVAHDFNNLLMGIMGYAELCRDALEPNSPLRAYLDEITNGAKRSAAITRQLLAFARKQTIAPVVMNLNDAVPGMIKLLRRLVGEDIELVWRPGPEMATIMMDPSQLDQILANLTVNARDAIGGVGKLIIETANVTLDATFCARHDGAVPGTYVRLAVIDTGSGMDKATLAHLFEPFFTTKRAGEGTGLGLATVYGIVKQNAGYIDVLSEPGKGTTFSIYMPQCAGPTAAAAAGPTPAKRPGGTETILLAEDEKAILAMGQVFLEALGYIVLTAERPEQALRLALEHSGPIHLLIADVVMPGLSGRDLAKRLVALRPETKCIFISGYTADIIADHGILDKDVNFLPKPFNRDDLARKVREVLGGGANKSPGGG